MTTFEFYQCAGKAWVEVEQYKEHSWRYSQALYKLLPSYIISKINQTPDDFYYYDNSRWQEINQICLKYCDDFNQDYDPEMFIEYMGN